MNKRSEETQTLLAGCSKAVPKIIAPPQILFPGERDRQNWISWRWLLPAPTNPVWWGSMHAIPSYRGNSPTHMHSHPQTGPITIHCNVPQLARSVTTWLSLTKFSRKWYVGSHLVRVGVRVWLRLGGCTTILVHAGYVKQK